MKKINTLILFAAFAAVSLQCGKKKTAEENPSAAKLGVFTHDKATLTVQAFNESYNGETMDFQLEYNDPKVSAGTLFGTAEPKEYNSYVFDYESNHVEFVFDDNSGDNKSRDGKKWNVKHTLKDEAGKKKFNYSGLYTKTGELKNEDSGQ